MNTPTDLSDQAIALGRFGHHPDPATDFEVEVECLQGRLFNAAHGIACPECQPESVREVFDAIQDAMTFRVGGNPGTVYAKQLLRALESYARELQAQQGRGDAFVCTGDQLRCFDGNGCECELNGLKGSPATPSRGDTELCQQLEALARHDHSDTSIAADAADAIRRLSHRGAVEVTDEMISRACDAFLLANRANQSVGYKEMRAALNAAMGGER